MVELAAWRLLSIGCYPDKTILLKKSIAWLETYMVVFIMGISLLTMHGV